MVFRILFIVLLSVITAFHVEVSQRVILHFADAQSDENRTRFYNYNEEEQVLSLLGFEPLSDSITSPGEIHIRVWYSFGSTSPRSLFLLQKKDSKFTGGFYKYWSHLSDDLDEVEDYADGYITNTTIHFSRICEDIRMAPTVITCRRKLKYEPDWEDLISRLTDLGIFTIPDMDSLGIPSIELEDGTIIIYASFGGSAETIETFDGTHYRRETYLSGSMVDDSHYMQILRAIGTSMPWAQ